MRRTHRPERDLGSHGAGQAPPRSAARFGSGRGVAPVAPLPPHRRAPTRNDSPAQNLQCVKVRVSQVRKSSCLLTLRAAVPTRGRRSKPSPRFFSISFCSVSPPSGPLSRAIRVVWVPTGLRFHGNWPAFPRRRAAPRISRHHSRSGKERRRKKTCQARLRNGGHRNMRHTASITAGLRIPASRRRIQRRERNRDRSLAPE